MEDYIILRTGFNKAVNESLESLKDLSNYCIIEDRLKRIQKKNDLKDGYLCEISKYYDSENKIGFIIFDDIYKLKGVQILINENQYVEISEMDCIFAKKNLELIWSEKYAYQDNAESKYKNMISKFKHV